MYRKFKGQDLFTGSEMLNSGEVLVTDEAGKVIEITGDDGISDVEIYDGLLCPGFVNAHCHLELSWMKGLIPKNTGMIDFLLGVMKTKRADAGELEQCIKDAENQMLESGIVAVGDICNTTVTVLQKKQGNIYYHNFIETMGFVDASAEARFSQSLEIFNEFAQHYPMPLACNSIVPHSPYSVSKSLFQKVIHFPGNQLLTIHNQEHPAENEFFMKGTGEFHRLFEAIGVDSSFHKGSGKSSVQHFLPWFLKNQSLILVHNTETNEADLEFINNLFAAGISTWFCLCPNANLYINSRLPDVDAIARYSDRVVIGTDSLASNESLNILEELKTIHRNFPGINITEMLKWATINGARALDIDDEIGSFSAGKQPGIVLIKGITETGDWQHATSSRIL